MKSHNTNLSIGEQLLSSDTPRADALVHVLNYYEKEKNRLVTPYFDMSYYSEEELETTIAQIGTDLLCTKFNVGYGGGGFVQAILNNDLTAAIGRADEINRRALTFYIVMLNCL